MTHATIPAVSAALTRRGITHDVLLDLHIDIPTAIGYWHDSGAHQAFSYEGDAGWTITEQCDPDSVITTAIPVDDPTSPERVADAIAATVSNEALFRTQRSA